MTLNDLLKARDAAVTSKEQTANAVQAAQQALSVATEKDTAALNAVEVADQAIHDLLIEKGDHYMQHDGALAVYKASKNPPGWFADHPIPGFSK